MSASCGGTAERQAVGKCGAHTMPLLIRYIALLRNDHLKEERANQAARVRSFIAFHSFVYTSTSQDIAIGILCPLPAIPTTVHHLQPRQPDDLSRRMVSWHLHVERCTRVAQVFTRKHRALLADEQRCRVRVAPDVIGADGQISDLEALDAVHI